MTPTPPGHGQAASTPPRQVAWRGVVPAFAATTVGMLPGFLLAGAAVQIREDIGLSLSGLGFLIGTFFGVAAATSTTMGRLTERVGWTTGLRLATGLTAASLAGVGWLADSTWIVAIFLAIGGVGSALGQVASNLAVARCVRPNRQGFVFGLRHAAVPTAAFLAGLAVPTIVLTVGWRWGFRGAVLLTLLAAMSIPRSELPHIVNPPPQARTDGGHRPATPMRLLILLSIAVGLGTGAVDTVASFLVSYAVEQGIAEANAGFLLAAGSLLGVAARIIAGWLIDRIRHADLTAVAAMIGVGAVGVLLLNVGGTPGFFVGALLAFVAGWGWAGLFTFAVVKDNPEAPAFASGVTQTGKYIGAALGPPIFGTLADRVSFNAAWWFTTTAMLGAASLMIYVRNRRPQ